MKNTVGIQNKKRHFLESKISLLERKSIILPILLCFLLLAIIAGVAIGPIVIPFSETINILISRLNPMSQPLEASQNVGIVQDIRLPRVIVSGIVGAALAVSGAAMQGLFRNPLVEPGYLGVSSGAALGAVCAIY